jgi:hypothetical protein
MSRVRVLIVIGLLCVLSGVGGIAFFLGDRYALINVTIRQATPDQLATAMQNDEFYSDYIQNTLLVRGSVASMSGDRSGGVLEFQTQGGFKTRCQLDQYPATIHVGDTISVVTQGATAERLTSAVLLRGCILLGG